MGSAHAEVDPFGELLLWGGLIAGIIYCIPTAIAFFRSHPNRWLIAVINLALGGTILGWFGSLIWALSAVHRSPTGNHGGESGLNLFANDPVLVQEVPSGAGNNLGAPADLASTADRLKALKALHSQGLITEAEFNHLRQSLIEGL
jgi:hypothetical protein